MAALWAPWATPTFQHFLRHHPGYVSLMRLSAALLLVGPAVYARRVSLRRRAFIFDRARDYVTCDDRVVCALSEVESVRVGKPLGWEGDLKGLSFLIHGRNEVAIEWDDLLGAGLEELGQAGLALSQYAQVPLWLEGEWRDPRNPLASAPMPSAAQPMEAERPAV